MNYEEAKTILIRDVLSDDGLYFRLRLGDDVDMNEVTQLRTSLRVLWRSLSLLNEVPYEVAYPCAIILRFSCECDSNYKCKNLVPNKDRESAVEDLSQGAFDLLSGSHARSWVVTRIDLGDTPAV